VRLSSFQEKFLLLALCAPLFAAAHVFNGWMFQQWELSSHIAWIYLPAFLRLAYVLVLGPGWGFLAVFLGSLLLGGRYEENLLQASTNAFASALGPVLALWLFKILKERSLQISRLSDLVQMCILYALLNALVHHAAWSYNQPDQLMSVHQMPIMVIGDLAGAVLGSVLFTVAMRQLGFYSVINRISQSSSAADDQAQD
jgi:hypothetical protein